MSTWVTNAPVAYDYENIVQETTPLAVRFSAKLGLSSGRAPLRKVELDDREDGYYVSYQIGRYQSGMYLTMTWEKYQQEVRDGYIEEEIDESSERRPDAEACDDHSARD